MISPDIFRNYDVRGEYPTKINADAAYEIGRAFVVLKGATHVAVGADMRDSSEELKQALINGITDQGADVTDIGLSTTDGIYFASHHYEKFDGAIVVTASHMPGKFNGFKFLDRESRPIGKGSGMDELAELVATQNYQTKNVSAKGKISEQDIWSDYKEFVLGFVDTQKIKPLKVVMDAGNGMGGFVADKVYADLPIEIIPMFFDPDGNFPNHGPNPLEAENRVDIINKVKEVGADLGVAWDADCDRVFFIDEKGQYVDGDFVTVLLGLHVLQSNPGAGIVYDIRASRAVKDIIEAEGGKTYPEKIGHTYIKHRMREEDALFGGEVSGHYYIKENAYAENGFVIPLMLMEILSQNEEPLSSLISGFGDYYISGEINSTVESTDVVIEELKEKYQDAESIDYTDGISIEYKDWHFNVRPSSNDPVIRLNLEANTKEMMEEKRDEVLAIIRGEL